MHRFSEKIRVPRPAFLLGEFSSSAVGADVSCNDGEMKFLAFQFVFDDGGISERPGSYFPSSSNAVFVGGGLVLAEAGGCVVHSEGVFCGGFDIDDVFSGEVIFCVDVLAFYVPSMPMLSMVASISLPTTWRLLIRGGLVIIPATMLCCTVFLSTNL